MTEVNDGNEGGRPGYDEESLLAALERLSGGDGLETAELAIARVAPQLRVVLADALGSGGWFGESHDAETLKAATIPDEERRLEAVRALLTEETNIGMMVGVAVGWALREELERSDADSQTGGA